MVSVQSQAAMTPEPGGRLPFDIVDSVLFALADGGLRVVLSMPRALRDAADGLFQIPGTAAGVALQTLLISIVVLAGYALARRASAQARERAAKDAVPFFALLKQIAYELLPLLVAATIGRVVVQRWLNIPAGEASFGPEMIVVVVRWLFAVAFVRFVFQPYSPALRLVGVDDAGSVKAFFGFGALFAFGYAHQVVLQAALRGGFPAGSANSLTTLAALLMLTGAVRLLWGLRRHGLSVLLLRTSVLALTVVTALWIWGVLSGDYDLFRGAIRAASIVILGCTFDRMLALSIDTSRRPGMMRRLFVVRVLIGAVAFALIVRVLVEFWFSGAPFLFGPSDPAHVLRRVNLAALMFVGGVTLSAMIHVWVQARVTPVEGQVLTPDEALLRARLSTVLPIVRFGAISVILLVTALCMFSVLGVDVTPLMGAAGILGLAISLGSQTLVKDVVSGLFYMFDDVFRVGETIESNGLRGRLEQISTRSVRLRDAGGRVHTVAFGDLGTITNHSRRLVRISVQVTLSNPTGAFHLDQLSRRLVDALRSETLLQTGIIGTIDISRPQGDDAATIHLTYVIGAEIAQKAERLTHRLIVSELDEAGIPARDADVATRLAELSDTAESDAPQAASSP